MKPLTPLIIFSIFAIFIACAEQDEFEPYLKGDIIGNAYCFNEYGNALEDFSGIKVTTEPDRKYSAVTNKEGRYVLKGVVNGTYDLSFEKEGFGTMKLFSIQHLGGSPTVVSYYYDEEVPFLFGNITTEITQITYRNDSITAALSFSGDYRPANVFMMLMFSKQENFDQYSADTITNIMVYNADNMNFKSYYVISKDLPFTAGETVYCKATIYSSRINAYMLFYGHYINGMMTYYDAETKTTVYPNLSNESYAFSFNMP
jgi:hypothetical protein